MHRVMMAAAAACGTLAAGAARADVIYNFSETASGQTLPFVVTFDLTDAQVASGGFTLSGTGNGTSENTLSGDVGGFSSLRIGSDTVTPTYIDGTLGTDLTFNLAGDITSLDLSWQGVNTDAAMVGTGAFAGAQFTDIDPLICDRDTSSGGCSVTGPFTRMNVPPSPVPEPASLAVLGAGVIGLGLARRRRASSPV